MKGRSRVTVHREIISVRAQLAWAPSVNRRRLGFILTLLKGRVSPIAFTEAVELPPNHTWRS